MTVIIKLRGLPWSATANEVREFFRGLSLREDDIHLAPSKDGKASGIAFAVFHSDEDARKAMFRTGKYIGKRYVELALSSVTEMEKYLLEGVPEPRKQRSERIESDNYADMRGRNGNANVNRDVDRENGLARRSRSRSRSPIGRNRYLGNGDRFNEPRRLPVGDRFQSERVGYERFEQSSREVDRESKNFERNEGRFRVDWENVDRERRNGSERQRDNFNYRENHSSGEPKGGTESPFTCVRVIGLPFDVREEDVRRFFEGLNIVAIHFLSHKSGTFAGKPNGWGYVEFRSVGDCIHAGTRNHQFIGKRYVEVKRCSREQMLREIDSSGTNREERPRRGNLAEQRRYERQDSLSPDPALNLLLTAGMESFIGGQPLAVDNNPAAMMLNLAAGANVSANDIRSGCVLGMRNLPSSITAEEILDFFYGFPVAPDSIRIHYLAPGRSSGDAMVTLPTAPDALSAIEQLNYKPVGKRNVQLFLI